LDSIKVDSSKTFSCKVSEERFRLFCEATAADPVQYKTQNREDGLKDHAWRLPPTTTTIFREKEFEFLKDLGLSLSDCLHFKQSYVFHRDLFVEQEIHGITKLESSTVKEKGGKPRTTLVFRTVLFENEKADKNPAQEIRTTIIVQGRAIHATQ
jgi:hypothetical protein